MTEDDRPSLAESGEPYFSLHNEPKGRAPDGRPIDWHEWAEIVVPMTSGSLVGFTMFVRLELIDGAIKVTRITYEPKEPADLSAATNRALRQVCGGVDILEMAEGCLRNLADQGALHPFKTGLEWLDAFASTRKRAGRPGAPLVLWARVAQRRIMAEADAPPGRAIHYMRRTWPDEFGSTDQSVSAKVNKAMHKGMIEFTDVGPRLTEQAQRLLSQPGGES